MTDDKELTSSEIQAEQTVTAQNGTNLRPDQPAEEMPEQLDNDDDSGFFH